MADMMAEQDVVGRPGLVSPPPIFQKKVALNNECLGIFMHFESIFLVILKMDFFKLTHRQNLEIPDFLSLP